MFSIFLGIVFLGFVFFKIRDLKKKPLDDKRKKINAKIILVTLSIMGCMFILAGIGTIVSEDNSLNGKLNSYASKNAPGNMGDVKVEIFEYSIGITLFVKHSVDEDALIRDGSLYALKTAKDIYENCPEANRIYFEFDTKFVGKDGKKDISKAFGFYYNREMAEKVDYDNFTNIVFSDYNKMWDVIETVYIHPGITRELKKFSLQQFMAAQKANSHENRVKEFVDKIDDSWENEFLPEQLEWSKRSTKAMNWGNAVNYCETLNENNYDDWKLPTIGELRTLIKNCPKTELNGVCKIGKKNCLSYDCFMKLSGFCSCEWKNNNSGYYSKTGDDDKVKLWSSSSLSESQYSNYRWRVDFTDGGIGDYEADADNLYVRCVRYNTKKIPVQKSADKKVSEQVKNLEWSHQASRRMNWKKAKDYCDKLNEQGYMNWRLPTISELRTIIQHCPATETGGLCGVVDSCLSQSSCWSHDACGSCPRDNNNKYSKFKMTNSDRDSYPFWSSSVIADHTDSVWVVSFISGLIGNSETTFSMNVRCVRDAD